MEKLTPMKLVPTVLKTFKFAIQDVEIVSLTPTLENNVITDSKMEKMVNVLLPVP
jgi:hypothetical protein